jgi:hypothetical protein
MQSNSITMDGIQASRKGGAIAGVYKSEQDIVLHPLMLDNQTNVYNSAPFHIKPTFKGSARR